MKRNSSRKARPLRCSGVGGGVLARRAHQAAQLLQVAVSGCVATSASSASSSAISSARQRSASCSASASCARPSCDSGHRLADRLGVGAAHQLADVLHLPAPALVRCACGAAAGWRRRRRSSTPSAAMRSSRSVDQRLAERLQVVHGLLALRLARRAAASTALVGPGRQRAEYRGRGRFAKASASALGKRRRYDSRGVLRRLLRTPSAAPASRPWQPPHVLILLPPPTPRARLRLYPRRPSSSWSRTPSRWRGQPAPATPPSRCPRAPGCRSRCGRASSRTSSATATSRSASPSTSASGAATPAPPTSRAGGARADGARRLRHRPLHRRGPGRRPARRGRPGDARRRRARPRPVPSVGHRRRAGAAEIAQRCEAAAFAVDRRIVNSRRRRRVGAAVALLRRQQPRLPRRLCQLAPFAVGGADRRAAAPPRRRDAARRLVQLDARAGELAAPEAVGRYAAERALARLGSRKIATCEVPVLFESTARRRPARRLRAGDQRRRALPRRDASCSTRSAPRCSPHHIDVAEDPHRAAWQGQRAVRRRGRGDAAAPGGRRRRASRATSCRPTRRASSA